MNSECPYPENPHTSNMQLEQFPKGTRGQGKRARIRFLEPCLACICKSIVLPKESHSQLGIQPRKFSLMTLTISHVNRTMLQPAVTHHL